eukprot:symbB.v1.2.001148.t1/scaffold47.1/size388503/3
MSMTMRSVFLAALIATSQAYGRCDGGSCSEGDLLQEAEGLRTELLQTKMTLNRGRKRQTVDSYRSFSELLSQIQVLQERLREVYEAEVAGDLPLRNVSTRGWWEVDSLK